MFKQFKNAMLFGVVVLSVGFGTQNANAQEADGSGSPPTGFQALATGCDTSSVYGPTGVYSYRLGPTSDYFTKCSSYSANNTADQNSVVATSSAVLRAATSQSARLVSNRVSNAIGGSTGGFNVADNGFSASGGLASGNGEKKIGVWVSGSYSDIEDENTSTAFDGEVYTVLGGVDYKVSPRTIVGVSVGYEDIDVDTAYNGNSVTGEDGSLEADGYTIAPYIGVRLSDTAEASLTVGYSDLEYDTVRFDPVVNNRITGSTDAERYFISGSVSGVHMFRDNWRLRGTGSVFYASEEKDAFNETDQTTAQTLAVAGQDTDFGQIVLDARLGYMFRYVEPYALAGVEFDFSKDEGPVASTQTQSAIDDEDFGGRFGGGLNLRLGDNVTGSVEAYTVEFRDDYNEYTVTGGLRVEF